jgi:hypothetical protein
MELARSTFYKGASQELDETALVERMHAIRASFRLTATGVSRRSCAPKEHG